MKLQENYGERFKQLRSHLGLTQTQMGEIVGVHYVTICDWEKVEPCFKGKHIQSLRKLGINPMYCYDDTESIARAGFTFEQVCKNVKNVFNKPESEESDE